MFSELVKNTKIWCLAYTTMEKLWRVRYDDGGITRLLSYSEAWNMVRIYGGQMFIDYNVKV